MVERLKDYYPPGEEAPPTVKEPYRDYIPGEPKKAEPAPEPPKAEIKPEPIVDAPKVEDLVEEKGEEIAVPVESAVVDELAEAKPKGKKRGPKAKKKK